MDLQTFGCSQDQEKGIFKLYMQFTIVWRGNEQEACAILIIDVLYGKKGDFYEYYKEIIHL